MLFVRKKINEDEEINPFSLFKNTREEQNLSLDFVSTQLNIAKKYLNYLEEGSINKLPKGVYGKSFLKKYSLFLKLDYNQFLTYFNYNNNDNIKKDIFAKKKLKKHEFVVLPKIIKSILIFFIIFLLFIYLGFSLKLSLSSPKITILKPENNLVTNNRYVIIEGITNIKTDITINNKPIIKDNKGKFIQTLNLKKGVNTVVITGKNKYSKKTIIKKQILVK